jgi:hypothetical protein
MSNASQLTCPCGFCGQKHFEPGEKNNFDELDELDMDPFEEK